MPITKQDIKKVADALKKVSVKDSEFKELPSVSDETVIAVVDDNKNAKTTAKKLLDYVSSTIRVDNIPLNIPGVTVATLGDLLVKIVRSVTDDQGHFLFNTVSADDVIYSSESWGYSPEQTDLKFAVDLMMNMLHGRIDMPIFATQIDITGMFQD